MAAPEVDHIIIFCAPGAPEAEALLERGLHEGPGNEHPGQGTVNRRFFFRNVYLELVWFENFEEARHPEVQRTGLWDRWVNRASGCPIGLVLRPGPEGSPAPFPSWTYVPKYFPAGFSIEVAHDIPANEPLLIYLPFARPAVAEDVAQSPCGLKIGPIAGFTLHLPEAASLSQALNSLVAARVVSVEAGREVLVDIHHQTDVREIIDLRPRLPLRFLPVERRNRTDHQSAV